MTRVVAAVILRDFREGKRVLACRRVRPPALAGKWEFPGGKVEHGEADVPALTRELREELGVEATIIGPIGGELPMIGGPGVWQPYVADIGDQEPELIDHDEFRWLAPEQLDELPWLSSDVPIMDDVRALLRPGSSPRR